MADLDEDTESVSIPNQCRFLRNSARDIPPSWCGVRTGCFGSLWLVGAERKCHPEVDGEDM